MQRQTVFAADGKIEPEEGPIETSLEDYGADVDHRERTARIDEPSASEFGVDDRPEVTNTDDGEQAGLYLMGDPDQQTLDGESAAGQSRFEEFPLFFLFSSRRRGDASASCFAARLPLVPLASFAHCVRSTTRRDRSRAVHLRSLLSLRSVPPVQPRPHEDCPP